MNDLKPCPFCGGEAVISVDPDAVEDTQGRRWAYNAVCIRCCATSGLTYTPQNAKEAWNRREKRTYGRWIEREKYTFGTMYDCSICGTRILDNGHSWNYCSHCGAKMDGGADHEAG